MADRNTKQVWAGRETQNCAKDICGQMPTMTCIRISVFTMYFLRDMVLELYRNTELVSPGYVKRTPSHFERPFLDCILPLFIICFFVKSGKARK